MNGKLAALAALSLLISGCATNGTVAPPAEPDPSSPIASATPHGAATTSATQPGQAS